MKNRVPDPIDLSNGWSNFSFAWLRMQHSATQVFLQRSIIMGSGKMGLVEAQAMVTEKYVAAAVGALQGTIAASRGANAAQIAGEVLEPVSAQTHSNAQRLRP